MSDVNLFAPRKDAAAPSLSALDQRSDWPFVLSGLALALGALLLAYGATFADMAGVWWRSETYEHGLLVLPTLAYILWDWRSRIGARPACGSFLGLPLASLCGLIWLAADLVGAAEGQHLALVAGLVAVVLATLGRAAFGAALPPLLLLAFLVPTGHQVLPALKSLTVWFAVAGPELAGLATEAKGYQLSVAGQSYIVIDECAALGKLLASSFLGLTMGLLLFRRVWKMLLFAAIGGLLAILVNGLRVNAIVLYNHLQSKTMDLSDHMSVGWVLTAISLAGLLALAYRWRDPKREREPAALPAPLPATGQPRRAVALGFASAALFILVPYVWPLAAVEPAAGPEAKIALPERLGTWQLSRTAADWQPRAERADRVVEARYDDGAQQANVFVATAASLGAEVSGASFRLLRDNKAWWSPASGRTELCDPEGCLPVERVVLDQVGGPRFKEVVILRLVDGQPAATATRMRLSRAWRRLLGTTAEAAVIVLSFETTTTIMPEAAALDLLRRLTAVVHPER